MRGAPCGSQRVRRDSATKHSTLCGNKRGLFSERGPRGPFLISRSGLEIDAQTKKVRELWAASCCFLLGSEEVAGRIFCLQPLVEWQEKKKGSFEGSLIQTSWTECQALPCPGESLSGASVEQVCLQCLLERLFPTLQRRVDLKAADFLPFLI